MVQPIDGAISAFLAIYTSLPTSVKALIGLSCVLLFVAMLIKLLYHARS